jgi:hypothetical protein
MDDLFTIVNVVAALPDGEVFIDQSHEEFEFILGQGIIAYLFDTIVITSKSVPFFVSFLSHLMLLMCDSSSTQRIGTSSGWYANG